MSDWMMVRLNEIADINPSEKLSKGTLAVKIGMEHLQPFTKKISGHILSKYTGGTKFRNGDTLVARITPCLENGKTAYVDMLKDKEVGFGSTEYIVLRAKENLSTPHFIYYLARSEKFRQVAIASMTGTSGRQRVQTDVLVNHVFNVPPVIEQEAISELLKSLDDKIELLHRQNKTLEDITKALFREWFIYRVNENWTEVKIKDYVTLNGSNITRTSPLDEILYLDTGSLTKGIISELQSYKLSDAPSRAKRLVKHNDIVLSTVRPNQCHYGIIGNPKDNLVVSTGFCTITCEKISPYFIYLLLTTEEMTEYLHRIAENSTSAYPALRPNDIADVTFRLPAENMLKEFHEIAEGNWNKIHANYEQIQTLEQLRDLLLPKLMNGEIRVELD